MSDYFPNDVLQDILKWLPTKCLIKCTSVCRSWRSLIQTPSFINAHLARTIQNDADSLLFLRASAGHETTALYSLRGNDTEIGELSTLVNPYPYIKRAVFPPSERVFVRDCHVVGTCNGLVCLAVDFAYFGSQVIVWNPRVRKFVMLPKRGASVDKSGRHKASYGFGYDSCANDYKVLRSVTDTHGKTPSEVEVWSLAGGSWKCLSADVIPEDFMLGVYDSPSYALRGFGAVDTSAFVNGALHWVQRHKLGKEKFILCFDMGRESFAVIMMPQGLGNEECFVLKYEECLALIKREQPVGISSGFDIWVMKEYGVVESWTKLFTIQLQGRFLVPLCFTRSGELVLKKSRGGGGQLLKVDLKSKQVKLFGIDGYKCDFMDSFVESLVLLGKANTISY